MATICYHASHEQFTPSHLLELVVRAERAGFEAIHSSDHFHPWSKRQGQSGFTFSWIAAAMQATQLPFSMVCAPGQRLHPAIVAQAIATLGEMFPGRFGIELGSGEALNEMITGDQWPDKPTRNKRLLESAEMIRRLLQGEEVSMYGQVKVREARLYTRPQVLPLLFGCAISLETARWIGSWADGLLTTCDDLLTTRSKIDAFRDHGGQGKSVYVQMAFSYARTTEHAIMSAWDQWRSNLATRDQLAIWHRPEQFDEASKDITPDHVAGKVPIFTSIDALEEELHAIERVCEPDRIILHNVNHYQEDFIEDFAVLAARRKILHKS